MPRRVLRTVGTLVLLLSVTTKPAGAQTVTQRGFAEGTLFVFPQDAPNDPTRAVGDGLAREDVFVKPAAWVQFALGADLRANSHEQVEETWRVDIGDRGVQRPRLSIRRLTATITRGPLTVDVGKQFIRWGKADIVTPTDRFAPRDFLNVIDNEFLAVTGVRAVAQAGANTFDGVWVPRFTPSRVPLLDQRWTAVPEAATQLRLVDATTSIPDGHQFGVRWARVGAGVEYALSYFDGFNHLPNIDATIVSALPPASGQPVAATIAIERIYPAIRTYGIEAAVPSRWFTVKGEAAYFTSAAADTDEYVIYVIQLERQAGEWVIVGGYAGEVVTKRRAALTFAPDRGLTRSVVARASYTIDANRSVAFETAVRQTGDGVYAKAEYSHAYGAHWRGTVTAVAIAGHSDDFLGQYRRNSHAAATLRYSF